MPNTYHSFVQLSEQPSHRSSPAAQHSDAPSPEDSATSSLHIPSRPASESSNIQPDDTAGEELVELLHSMNINVKHTHYVGKSSSMTFVRAALALKDEYVASGYPGGERDRLETRQPEFYDATMVC